MNSLEGMKLIGYVEYRTGSGATVINVEDEIAKYGLKLNGGCRANSLTLELVKQAERISHVVYFLTDGKYPVYLSYATTRVVGAPIKFGLNLGGCTPFAAKSINTAYVQMRNGVSSQNVNNSSKTLAHLISGFKTAQHKSPQILHALANTL